MTDVLNELAGLLRERRNADPGSSYVASLHHAGLNRILEKVGEEATETILAAKDSVPGEDAGHLVHETADLWFHTLVMLSHLDVAPGAVLAELESRLHVSGHAEKAARTGKSE